MRVQLTAPHYHLLLLQPHTSGQIRLLLDPDPLSPVLLLNRCLGLNFSTCHQMLLVLQQEASSCTRNPTGLSVVQTKEKQ